MRIFATAKVLYININSLFYRAVMIYFSRLRLIRYLPLRFAHSDHHTLPSISFSLQSALKPLDQNLAPFMGFWGFGVLGFWGHF